MIERRQLVRVERHHFQQSSHARVFRARFAHAEDSDLAELLEFLPAEAVYHQSVKVRCQKATHIISEPVIRDDVDQYAAHHQVVVALAKEPLFAPRTAVHL